ncbi:MAG: ribonuclease P protein component [Candidatus Nomurabacteria bacterium]|jgi:ribonuclease P protein component|nr:ribonuclease P protein component [Candidatus Nomurabacteria bacterium]
MLAAKYRFHSRGGVQAVLRHGKTERGERISLVWMKNRRGGTRFGVVISKKVLKSAVGRNRVRRRVYEVLREWLAEQAKRNGFPPKLDALVILYSADFRETEFTEFKQQIVGLLEKAAK